ncbi:MAG: rRNA maturation RNase YbeY [Bacilli bacterium]|nr:rRNA maturation RNase YbeY [Bacilli bacterium]
MNKIGYFSLIDKNISELKTVKKVINYTLKKENLTNVEFNIIIVDNDKIRTINRDYRKIDRETDVISFALEDYQEDIDLYNKRVLGDIYISYDRVCLQALEYGHTNERELAFLSVHGLLHLLGYDHMNKEDEEIMFAKQEMILDECGITR